MSSDQWVGPQVNVEVEDVGVRLPALLLGPAVLPFLFFGVFRVQDPDARLDQGGQAARVLLDGPQGHGAQEWVRVGPVRGLPGHLALTAAAQDLRVQQSLQALRHRVDLSFIEPDIKGENE